MDFDTVSLASIYISSQIAKVTQVTYTPSFVTVFPLRFSDQHQPSPNNSKLVGFLMLVVVATMTRMAKRVRCKFIKCHFNGAIYPIGWESNMGQGSTRIVGDDGDNDNIHIYNRTIIDTLDRPKVTSLPQ
jgi:hypothetical protein